MLHVEKVKHCESFLDALNKSQMAKNNFYKFHQHPVNAGAMVTSHIQDGGKCH